MDDVRLSNARARAELGWAPRAPQIWDDIFSGDRCKFSSLTVAGVSRADAFSSWLSGSSVVPLDGYDGLEHRP